MRKLLLASALTCLLLGCSDSDGGGTPSVAEPDPNDTRTEAERSADEAAAQGAVLTLVDFPPGWEAEPGEEDDEDSDDIMIELAECLGEDPAIFTRDNPEADSPTFVSDQDGEVESEVVYTSSVEAASETMSILRGEDVPACFGAALQGFVREGLANPDPDDEPLPPDLEVGEPTFNPLSVAPVGDEVLAFRVTIPLAAGGFNVDFFADLVVVRVGRVGVNMSFSSPFSPFPSDEAERLTEAVVNRIPPNS